MGQVPYVGFATYRRATAMTRFTFCIKKKKKRVITGSSTSFLLSHGVDP